MNDATNSKAQEGWHSRLKPGETLVWSADASPRLRKAEIARRRGLAALLAFVSLVLAAGFGWKLYETISTPNVSADLGAAIASPLYGVLGLTFLVVALAQLGRLNPKLTAATHYVATSHRILAADDAGAITDEIDAHDIAGFILGGRRSAPDLFALRSHDDLNVKTFAIEHIEAPLEAKAVLEQQFLEQPT
jgi:hypothetical protein